MGTMLIAIIFIMTSRRKILLKEYISKDKPQSGFQEILAIWKNNTLEGIHVEGNDRGRKIKL
jgi:hypothetical protein